MMRSRSRWNSVRYSGGGSGWRRPRDNASWAAKGASESGPLSTMSTRLSEMGLECSLERGVRVLGGDEGLADRTQQHEPDPSALHLLVDSHVLERGVRRHLALFS